MDKKGVFLSKTRTFLSDPKLLNSSVHIFDIEVYIMVMALDEKLFQVFEK
jgi:hypothetical protein